MSLKPEKLKLSSESWLEHEEAKRSCLGLQRIFQRNTCSEVTLPRSTWWVVKAKSGSCAPVLFVQYVQSSMSRGAPNELVLHRSIWCFSFFRDNCIVDRMPATSIYAGASRRDACSLFAGGFVATETLVFLNIFDIFYVSSRRSDAFHTLRRRNFVGSIWQVSHRKKSGNRKHVRTGHRFSNIVQTWGKRWDLPKWRYPRNLPWGHKQKNIVVLHQPRANET